MAEVSEEGELGAGAGEVWKIVRDFGGFIEAMGLPVELEGEGLGQTRKITMGGDAVVERLEERDDHAMRVVYTILSGPLPVRHYRSTMQLSPAGEGRATLRWSSTFEPAEGTSVEAASQVVSGIYKGGISTLQGRYGA